MLIPGDIDMFIRDRIDTSTGGGGGLGRRSYPRGPGGCASKARPVTPRLAGPSSAM